MPLRQSSSGARRPERADRAARRPALRLRGSFSDAQARTVAATDRAALGQPITGATDPRWVLALQTSMALEGTVLPAEKRDRLVRLGKLLGLSPFDANLVIAIVQEQARQGYAPERCPQVGQERLCLVPLPRLAQVRSSLWRHRIDLALLLAALLALELLLIKFLLL